MLNWKFLFYFMSLVNIHIWVSIDLWLSYHYKPNHITGTELFVGQIRRNIFRFWTKWSFRYKVVHKWNKKIPTPDTDNWNTENIFNENSLVSLPRQEIRARMKWDIIKLAARFYTRMLFYFKLLLKTKSQCFMQFYEDFHLSQPYFYLAFTSRI